MNKSKFTLTIGIPAHNEENNMYYLLETLLKQKQKSYFLEKIIIVCDGCTDNTENIIDDFAKKHSIINKYSDKQQLGKASRLNEIYQINTSELLLTLDADILLGSEYEIELLVNNFIVNPKLLLCTARNIPLPQSTLIGNISNVSYNLWQKAAQSFQGGRNIHTCLGSVIMLKGSMAKSVEYPKNTISDQGFIYIQSILRGANDTYAFEHKSKIYFRTVNSFEDFMLQGTRAIYEDKKNISKLYGNKFYYIIPLKYKIYAIVQSLIEKPLITVLTIGFGIYIRLFPYKKRPSVNGVWQMSKSSKILIFK